MRRPVVVLAADGELGRRVKAILLRLGAEALVVRHPAAVERAVTDHDPELVVLEDSQVERGDGLEAAVRLRRDHGPLAIVLVTPLGSEALAVAALRAGVDDYFAEPLDPDEVVARLGRLLGNGLRPPRGRRAGEDPTPQLIGDSAAMARLKTYLERVGVTDTTVLLTGETGTGKELAARMIHRASPRRARSLVCINCAAIPDTLLESELFGHERGAFTGAQSAQEGKLAQASGGTVLLDEIGDMSPSAQAKVLRVLETREVHRVGGRGPIPLDVRIIAATNHDLERSVATGLFRKDLYYRLNVARVRLPPLRERREDIAPLVQHFVGALAARADVDVVGLTDEAMERLLRYDWPGNVRELRNLLEAVFVNRPSGRISSGDFPEGSLGQASRLAEPSGGELERMLVALESTNWNKSQAAQRLHWSRVTLYRKMAKYHLTTRGTAAAAASAPPAEPPGL